MNSSDKVEKVNVMQTRRAGETSGLSGKQSCKVLTDFVLSYVLAFCTHFFFFHIFTKLWFCQHKGLKMLPEYSQKSRTLTCARIVVLSSYGFSIKQALIPEASLFSEVTVKQSQL